MGMGSSSQSEDERRSGDRRRGQRRDPRWRFDPLFAATLVNQIAPPEQRVGGGYFVTAPRQAGRLVNLRA